MGGYTTTTLDGRPAGDRISDAPAALEGEPLVLEVAPTATSPGAILLGFAFGAVAATLLAATLALALEQPLLTRWPVTGFFGGWLAAAWWLARDTLRLAVVVRRGALLGALQWMALSLAGRWQGEALANDGAAIAGRAAPGLLATLAGTPATVMLWLCAALFAVCWLATRQDRRAVV